MVSMVALLLVIALLRSCEAVPVDTVLSSETMASDVRDSMINDVLMSIRKVMQSENVNFDRDFFNLDLNYSEPETEQSELTTTITQSKSTTRVVSSEKLTTSTSTTTSTTTTSVLTSTSTTTKKSDTILKKVGVSEKDLTEEGLFEDITNEDEEPEEERQELCDTIPNNDLLRNGLGSTGFTWPEGKIPYEIAADFNETQRETIQAAIDYYNTEFSGCIQWVPKGDQANYVIFENTGTCSSRIGVAFYPLPISQTISLGKCSHLLGHIKHEMMHTVGFYHEHSRSDRDKYIKIQWNNIPLEYQQQFSTYRWTVGYGEEYDYQSIMHYSSRAFVRDYGDKSMRSIVPRDDTVDPDDIGFKANLSETDKIKIRKMYKCDPFRDYKVRCGNDEDCGLNEYCALFVGECRTKLPDGSVCVLDKECLNHCSGGVCSECAEDNHCGGEQYCAYKFLPAIQNECSGFCDSFCLFSAQCGGGCSTCTWSFTCQK